MRLAYGTDLVADGLVAENEGAEPFRRTPAGEVPGEPVPLNLDDRPDLKEVEQFISPDDGNGDSFSVDEYEKLIEHCVDYHVIKSTLGDEWFDVAVRARRDGRVVTGKRRVHQVRPEGS